MTLYNWYNLLRTRTCGTHYLYFKSRIFQVLHLPVLHFPVPHFQRPAPFELHFVGLASTNLTYAYILL